MKKFVTKHPTDPQVLTDVSPIEVETNDIIIFSLEKKLEWFFVIKN